MFKLEKLLLFLLIGVCLVVTVVLLDAVIDPSHLISTVYARLNDSTETVQAEVYVPELDEPQEETFQETAEDISVLVQSGWEVFRSEGFAFEIQFPKEIVRKSILNQDAVNSGVGLSPEAPVWQFRVDDPLYYQGTNLIDASLLIHVLEGQDQENQCLSFKQGSIYQTPNHQRESLIEVEINGVIFSMDEVIEGVMGEFYHRIIYRTYSKGACYELTQLIHFRNIAGLSDEKISEFDESLVITELDEVLNTFSLLDIEPTFPAQSYPVPKTITNAFAKSPSEHVDGLDVSHWQGTIQWGHVENAGYIFTFAKGTEGVGWTDVKFIYNMESGEDVGMKMGVYHFARPDLGNSGAAEANYFLSVAGDYLKSGYLRPVLDLEVGSSLGKVALSNWVLEWMETIKNRTGIAPLIYTNLNFVNNYLTDAVTDYDIWIAYWSCQPDPTYSIPPTGKWRDWAFWQYYGPGGCGGNAGFVPGIQTNIDLNIFNGVVEGLEEYDASSHLWVSLTSDAYQVPVPYYSDITANVNGDTAGPINFYFWWDCTALEADISLVEGSCGVLPVPPQGECVQDDVGMQCLGVDNEVQLAEYTYQEIGNYTAKVIVERGGAAPAEDRYKISTYNPIQLIITDPVSPGVGAVDSAFVLDGTVGVHTTVEGVLQVSFEDPVSAEIKDFDCLPVPSDVHTTEEYSLSWTESAPGGVVYNLSFRYRAQGECPVEDQHENDLSQLYVINWVDDSPVLELSDGGGNPLQSGALIDLGEVVPFQSLVLNYEITNPSETADFEVTSVIFNNLVNVSDLLVTPDVPFTVGPGEVVPITLSFDILTTGPISFEIAVDHNAINPSPFNLIFTGTARMATNPIQTINPIPASPGINQIADPFLLQIEVELDAPATGVLEVSLVNSEGSPVGNKICQDIPGIGSGLHEFDFSVEESQVGIIDYTIWARFRALGTCPISDIQVDDLSQVYQIDWQEDNPVLELQDSSFNIIDSGGIVDLGDQEAFKTYLSEYLIVNGSISNIIEVPGVIFEDLINVSNIQNDPPGPYNVNPGEQETFTISFDVDSLGDFSFVVSLEHNASNPSPYTFTSQGTGILVQNPLQSISPIPSSPGLNLIGSSYDLQVDVEIAPPASGALKVRLLDGDGFILEQSDCLEISNPELITKSIDFSWVEDSTGLIDYSIQSLFYLGGACQIDGSHTSELVMSYQIDWQEENPVLELMDSNGGLLADGETINIGQYEYNQDVNLAYQLHNTSTTNALSLTGLNIENITNLSQVNVSPTGQADINPDGTYPLEISFQVENTGSFSFDLVIDHLASNPTPYLVTFEGSGVMTNNPIKFVVPIPASPANSLIGDPLELRIDVGIDAPDTGSLQVSMIEAGSEVTTSQECLTLENNLNQARSFDLSWTRSTPGTQEYTLLTKYRAQEECPIEDSNEFDLSQAYSVNWDEDSPYLEVRDQNDAVISHGSSVDLGLNDFYQNIEFVYTLVNTSTTNDLDVSSMVVDNLINLDQVTITPEGPFVLDPEGTQDILISLLVHELDLFRFDISFIHDAANPSPYRIGFSGSGVMESNPILSLVAVPETPGSSLVSETYRLQITSDLDIPAPGILEIVLVNQNSELIDDPVCLEIAAGGISHQSVDFSWVEIEPADQEYLIRAQYQADAGCPLNGTPDAELTELYQIQWQILNPILIVNRPEGVTIFDGAVDYVGEHDFFRFVEVTYLIENDADASPLIVNNIQVENLENLREVLIEPELPFELEPGESQLVKINFQVLMLEPFSFDLVWEHNGSNPSPYQTSIQGDAKLNLGEVPVESWLYRFLDNLIRSGFFLKLPIFGMMILGRKKKKSKQSDPG